VNLADAKERYRPGRRGVPGRHDDAVASVYADIAHRFGWLTLDRTLTHDEYRHLIGRVEDWCTRDTFLSDVVTAFGAPSVLSGGTNPRFPKTIAYAAAEREAPLISFHFWNDARPDSAAGASSPIHPEPVLLCVQHRPGSFYDSFTYTPEGVSRRPVDLPGARPLWIRRSKPAQHQSGRG
jgi:hypothetical protein